MNAASRLRRAGSERTPKTDAQIIRNAVISMLLFTVFGGFVIYKSIGTRSDSEPVEGGTSACGVVVKVHEGTSRKGRTTYRAESSFTDSHGQEHTVLSQELPNTDRPHIGDRVTVSYDPDNPEIARDLTSSAGGWKVVLGSGIALIVVGWGLSLAFEIYPMLRRRRFAQTETESDPA